MKKLALLFLLLLTAQCFGLEFTISGEVDSSKVKMTRISVANPYYNYGAHAVMYVSNDGADELQKTLLHFTTLADTIKAYATALGGIWCDSAVITLVRSGTGGTGSEELEAFVLKRAFGEGAGTGSAVEGASYVNSDSTGGTATLWGTAGCNNTTTDRSATSEGARAFPATSGTSFTVPITGASIRDTLGGVTGGYGVVLQVVGTPASYYGFHSDDATTANRALRPKITVYYRIATIEAKTFTTGAATAAADKALKYNATIYQYAPTYNYGAATTTLVGFSAADREYKTMLNFLDFADSMRAAATRLAAIDSGVGILWDSALVTFQISAEALGSDAESLMVAFYPVIRKWGWEGTATGAAGEGVRWDSSYAAFSFLYNCTHEAWGTAGCNNTTIDRSATKETIPSRSIDTRIRNSQTGAITVPVSGATVKDTLGMTSNAECQVNGGLVLAQTASVGGGNENVTLKSDDDATVGNHPSILVYYRNVYVPLVKILNARGSNTLVGIRGSNTGGSVRGLK